MRQRCSLCVPVAGGELDQPTQIGKSKLCCRLLSVLLKAANCVLKSRMFKDPPCLLAKVWALAVCMCTNIHMCYV